jgi:L-seryl-tRNA(Ser) seleniumtransferase
MKQPPDKDVLRRIPSVDEMLAVPEITDLRERHPRFPWTLCIRDVQNAFRQGSIRPSDPSRESIRSALVDELRRRVEELKTGGARRVINATGVILHTNLGRAVLGETARKAADEAMGHYVSLEVDLDTGKRGGRGEVLKELIKLATGAEAAAVVNNCAAAVYLVVSSYSPPGRVLVSRGELVEIGGSFRLPELLHKAASETVEVGTTNRTYVEDYAREARPGDILMRAHRSNYDIQGFTHETAIADLVGLARDKRCHVVYDLGSGSLFDFAGAGIKGEERVDEILGTGVDCVTLSGDKLLGGMQAGIIVGREKFLDRLKQNPLRRAVRVDKVVIATMQAVMRAYLFNRDPASDVPTLQLAIESVEGLDERARALIGGLPRSVRAGHRVEVVEDEAAIGGGSFAVETVASVALAFRCQTDAEASALARRLRKQPVPILSRIRGNEVRLNMRSVMPYEDTEFLRALRDAFGE